MIKANDLVGLFRIDKSSHDYVKADRLSKVNATLNFFL